MKFYEVKLNEEKSLKPCPEFVEGLVFELFIVKGFLACGLGMTKKAFRNSKIICENVKLGFKTQLNIN